jgi:hypothetical protein
MRQASDDDESGRGLVLIDNLTGHRWDWRQVQGGKIVRALIGPGTPE